LCAWHGDEPPSAASDPGGRTAGYWTGVGASLAFAEHAQHAGLVGGGHQDHSSEVALAIAGLADHAVTDARLGSLGLSGPRELEPLGRGAIGLLLGHFVTPWQRRSREARPSRPASHSAPRWLLSPRPASRALASGRRSGTGPPSAAT